MNTSGTIVNGRHVNTGLPTRPTVEGSRWTILHDFGFAFGGAERVTRDIYEAVGSTNPIRYIAGDEDVLNRMSQSHSPLVNLPTSKSTYRLASPIYGEILRRRPPIVGNVIASSYAFCHNVPATGLRLVYCHSPFRQAWSGSAAYRDQGSFMERTAARAFGERWRRQDRRAAQGSSHYIATSRVVADRIAKYYGLNPIAIIPPAYDDSVYFPGDFELHNDSYLWVGRIVEPYKNLRMVVDYFNENPSMSLIVAGDGRDRRPLEARANRNIRFIGWQDEEQLVALYRTAKALIFPSEDDFGITPVEAMACGLPVIAYKGGGALDTVTEEQTGVFFAETTSASLGNAVDQFERTRWDRQDIAASTVRKYSRQRFSEDLTQLLLAVDL